MQQNSKAEQALLQKLATSETLDHAEGVVKNLAKKFGYRWHPVGNNEANYGSINIGSDPGVALIERVTNAIDAVIEREALRNSKKRRPNSLPTSPREAADLWFRIPGGRVASLGDPAKRQPIADNILIRLIEGRSRRRPTILIRDRGVGLTPDLIPKTILSLGGSNKIDKPYLSGAYGQGGSTVLAFSPNGTLFVSRRHPEFLTGTDTDRIAVTFAKYQDLDPSPWEHVGSPPLPRGARGHTVSRIFPRWWWESASRTNAVCSEVRKRHLADAITCFASEDTKPKRFPVLLHSWQAHLGMADRL